MTETLLYGIPGSHPAMTGELMLAHKGIPYRRVNLQPGLHRPYLRLRGFSGNRVPAVRFADGQRGQGTRPLARVLDVRVPEPRLVPADPRVEEAERWGDDVLQQWARRMVVAAAIRSPDVVGGGGGSGRLGPLLSKRDLERRVITRFVKPIYRMTKSQWDDDEGRVAEMLDRVDELSGAGVLDGEQLNCADFQIATSLALVEYRIDVRRELEGRPAAALLERVMPSSP